jgi:hypothetical protein
VTPARLHSDIEPGGPNEFLHHNDQPHDLLSPSRARSGRFAANARGAIPALCFTEDDVRKKFAQEEQWDELSDDEQRESILLLMDAGEYAGAATFADEAIAEAVARYIREAMLEEEERQEGSEPA